MIDQARIETHICCRRARRRTNFQAAIWTVCSLAIWQLVGCSSPINGSPLNALGGSTASSASGASQANWPTGEQLPPKQAAQACLATAKELHAHGDAREAILLFERARQLDPRQGEASRFLAVLYDQQGNDTKALAEYRKALDDAPRNADLLDGLALGEQDRYPESFEAFSKVLGPAAAHSNLGVILAAHQRPTEADAEFKQALRLKPDLPQPRAFLAHLEKPANTAEIQTASHLE